MGIAPSVPRSGQMDVLMMRPPRLFSVDLGGHTQLTRVLTVDLFGERINGCLSLVHCTYSQLNKCGRQTINH